MIIRKVLFDKIKPLAYTNNMITGTHHFISKWAAECYYKKQFNLSKQELRAEIERKIAYGEIKIGPPQIKNGQKLLKNKEEGRYFIKD